MSRSAVMHSVATTFAIVERLAKAHGPLGVSELAVSTSIGKARIYRHLRTLVGLGYVAQEALGERYVLTMKLCHLGQAIAEQSDFQEAARGCMPALRARVGQSVVIGQVEDAGVRVVEILRHHSKVEISSRPGTLFDFHCTAQGKLALAFGPARLWKRLQRTPLRKWTSATITDLERLRSEIDRVKRRGWAVAPGEILSGINALAAPIFDASGTLAGTIGILGSIQHVAPRPAPRLVSAVQVAARVASRRLGFRAAAAS
jgi:IclR family transcriptional regulator, KDG regulon repressor